VDVIHRENFKSIVWGDSDLQIIKDKGLPDGSLIAQSILPFNSAVSGDRSLALSQRVCESFFISERQQAPVADGGYERRVKKWYIANTFRSYGASWRSCKQKFRLTQSTFSQRVEWSLAGAPVTLASMHGAEQQPTV
jgi:hypothetical protein